MVIEREEAMQGIAYSRTRYITRQLMARHYVRKCHWLARFDRNRLWDSHEERQARVLPKKKRPS